MPLCCIGDFPLAAAVAYPVVEGLGNDNPSRNVIEMENKILIIKKIYSMLSNLT